MYLIPYVLEISCNLNWFRHLLQNCKWPAGVNGVLFLSWSPPSWWETIDEICILFTTYIYIPAPGTDIIPNSIWVACAIFKERIFGCWCNTVMVTWSLAPLQFPGTLLHALLPPPLWDPILPLGHPLLLASGWGISQPAVLRGGLITSDDLVAFFYCCCWGFIVYSLLLKQNKNSVPCLLSKSTSTLHVHMNRHTESDLPVTPAHFIGKPPVTQECFANAPVQEQNIYLV